MLKHTGEIPYARTGPGGFSVVWKAEPATSVSEILSLLSGLGTAVSNNENCPRNTPVHVNKVHGGLLEPTWSLATAVPPFWQAALSVPPPWEGDPKVGLTLSRT